MALRVAVQVRLVVRALPRDPAREVHGLRRLAEGGGTA